jgi:hypothetical protein
MRIFHWQFVVVEVVALTDTQVVAMELHHDVAAVNTNRERLVRRTSRVKLTRCTHLEMISADVPRRKENRSTF